MRRMQCKDIPDVPILEFLASLPDIVPSGYPPWANCGHPDTNPHSIMHVMPPDTDSRLAIAKMGMLIRRGLAKGCTCGCRGDFELTDKGHEFLRAIAGREIAAEDPGE